MTFKIRIAFFVIASLLSNCCAVINVPSPIEHNKPRVIVDDRERSVNLPQRVERAISLAPSLTEMVFWIGAGDKLVGVTTYCNYPAETAAIEKVGDTLSPNVEKIIALKPDVVLVSTASQLETFTKTLEGLGISVFVSDPKSLDDVYKTLGQLGDIFGRTEEVANRGITLSSRESFIRHSTRFNPTCVEKGCKFPTVFIQFSNEPFFTVGRDSFLKQVVESAGGELVTKDIPEAYPKLSKETALALNPDVIILSDSEDNQAPNEVFKNSPAVKNGRVYKINADIVSRPGPRLVDAIEQIAGFLHGEKN